MADQSYGFRADWKRKRPAQSLLVFRLRRRSLKFLQAHRLNTRSNDIECEIFLTFEGLSSVWLLFTNSLTQRSHFQSEKKKNSCLCSKHTHTKQFLAMTAFFQVRQWPLSLSLSLTLCLPLSNIFQRLYWPENQSNRAATLACRTILVFFMLATLRTVNTNVQVPVHQLKMSIFYPWFEFLVNFYFLAPSYRRIKRPLCPA